MEDRIIKEYPKDDVVVVWDKSRCTHSGNCARGLNSVFKPKEVPWITTDGASKEAIVAQVNQCPSNALSIRKVS